MVTPLGLDLSMRSTGWAVWGGGYGRIRTDFAAHRGLTDIDKRRLIADDVTWALDTATPGQYPWTPTPLAIIETPIITPGRYSTRDLFMLHAVVLDEVHRLGVAIAYVPPGTLKVHLAGRGDADMQQMIAAAQAVGYGGKQTDEADAWGLALIGHHLLGGTDHLTPQRSACLAKVSWEVPLVEAATRG